MTDSVPSKDVNKPERKDYPTGYFGDREYSEALTTWHRKQFGHAMTEPQASGPADGLCGIKGCTKRWRHPGDCAHGGESTPEPPAVLDRYSIEMEGDICGAVKVEKLDPNGEWVLFEDVEPFLRAAQPPCAMPEGFPAISDTSLRDLRDTTKSVLLQSALIELQMRRAAQPPVPALRNLLKPIELDHLIEWHKMCASVSEQTDDSAGARRHRERHVELIGIRAGDSKPSLTKGANDAS